MDSIRSIIRELQNTGASVSVEGKSLRVDAGKGVLDERLRHLIRAHKEELIAYISRIRNDDFKVIPRAMLQSDYPLSPSQLRLWILHQLDSASTAYNMPGAYVLEGSLDPVSLEQAFNRVIGRHEILRTVFRLNEQGEARQMILPSGEVAFSLDLRDLRTEANRDESVMELLRMAAGRVFDLSTGPLLWAGLFQTADCRWVFVCVMHHIISDGWSMDILIREVMMFYNAGVKGSTPVLPELHIQYKDYACWQLKQMQEGRLKDHASYWAGQFAGDLPVLELPADYIRPAVKTYRGGILSRTISPATTAAVKAVLQEEGCTLFMGLLAAVNTLLYHYTGRTDIILGTPVAGRQHADLEDQIGFYVNTLALRTCFSGEDSFSELLELVRQVTMGAYERQTYPFDEIVNDLQLHRDMSRSPLFDVMVVLQNTGDQGFPRQLAEGVSIEKMEMEDHVISKFDLAYYFMETGDGLEMQLEYNSDLFLPRTAARIADHFIHILQVAVQQPSLSIRRLEWLLPDERQLLLTGFNDTKTIYPSERTIISLLEEQAGRTPDNIALVFEEKALTYRQLYERSGCVAVCLQHKYHVHAGDLVAVKMERSERVVLAMTAVLMSGAACVMADTDLPEARMEYILSDSRCKLLLDEAMWDQLEKEAAGYSGQVPCSPDDCHDLAYVIYTSGSTGNPKGCMLEHKGIVNHLFSKIDLLKLTGITAICHNSDLQFVGGLWQLWAPLITGGKVILCSKEEMQDIERLLDKARTFQVRTLEMIPSQLNEYLSYSQNIDLSGIHTLILTGEKLNRHFVDKCYADNPDLEIINTYGQTECSDVTTYYRIPRDAGHADILIGIPIQNTRHYILSPENSLCPVGIVGEICTSGDGVCRGYLNNPALTSERFFDNPFVNDAKMYRTGDLGRWMEDGNLQIIGRKDGQVKIRGHRIEMGEVEKALLRYNGIEHVVLDVLHEPDGGKTLTAFIKGDTMLDVSAVRAHLAQCLPHYMIPGRYVRLEKLPLLKNGKVDRKALSALAGEVSLSNAGYLAPRDEVERELLTIWKEILLKEDIGMKDDFFVCGGHSLKVTRLCGRISKVFEVQLSLRQLFTTPVLEDQAKLIRQAERTSYSALSQVREEFCYPLSFAQRRMWVLSQFEEGGIAYHIQGAYIFKGDLNREALTHAYSTLIGRHEILRTVFGQHGQDNIGQFVLSTEEMNQGIFYRDRLTVQEDLHQPFDLSQGPLIRAFLYRVAGDRYVFAYVMHHIISDGWSMGLLISELFACYNAYLNGEPDPLPPLRIQYKDYAVWQQRQLSAGALDIHRQYWLDQFAVAPPVLALPADRPRPPVKTYRGGTIYRTLDKKTSRALQALVRQTDGTLFMGLLAAVNALLYRYTGQHDIVVGSAIAGREHPDLEEQIGFYVNTLPLRTRLSAGWSFMDLLAQVKQITLEGYAHQSYPFDQLMEDLPFQRDLSRSPLFDILIILQNTAISGGLERLTGVDIEPYTIEQTGSKFDLTFDFRETGEEINMIVEYNSDIYDESTIIRLSDHFIQLLGQVLERPEIPLQDIDFLSAGERQLLLTGFNNTSKDYPRDKTIVDLFERQVSDTPYADALITEEGTMTYADLNARANRLGHYLRTQFDIGRDRPVGIKLERGRQLIVSMLAIAKAGGACVCMDPAYPPERLAYIVDQSRCELMIDAYRLEAFAAVEEEYSMENLPKVNKPGDLVNVIYTSGSTGKPKGCMLEHRGVINHLFSKIDLLHLEKGDVICHTSELHFVGGIWQLWAPLITGGKVALCNKEEMASIERLLAKAKYLHARVLEIIPSQLHEYLSRESSIDLGTIRTLILTGEKLNSYFVNKCHSGNRGLEIINTYGQTECSDVTTFYRMPSPVKPGTVPAGTPIQNTQHYILSPEGTLAPIGIIGEVCTSGAGVCRGYINDPLLTGESFVTHPLAAEGKLYRTGDLGRWLADGRLEILGRKDEQVKIRGHRIEVAEIEQALMTYEGIEAAIVLYEEPSPAEQLLVAYVTGREPIDITGIRPYLSKCLPPYMLPGRFIQVDQLPLLPNGKVDKRSLLQSNGRTLSHDRDYVAPRNNIEQRLTDIWQDILGRQRIGVRDDFFALGGHSLKATRLISQIRKTFDADLNLMTIFNHPTIENMAGEIEKIHWANNRLFEIDNPEHISI